MMPIINYEKKKTYAFEFFIFRFRIGQYVTAQGDVVSHTNISHVTTEDGGEYSCIAENRAGRTTHSARLNIYGQLNLILCTMRLNFIFAVLHLAD